MYNGKPDFDLLRYYERHSYVLGIFQHNSHITISQPKPHLKWNFVIYDLRNSRDTWKNIFLVHKPVTFSWSWLVLFSQVMFSQCIKSDVLFRTTLEANRSNEFPNMIEMMIRLKNILKRSTWNLEFEWNWTKNESNVRFGLVLRR